MPDLADQLRTYVDGVAGPVTLDEVLARPRRARHRRPSGWLVAAAVLVVVAVAGVAVAVARPGRGRDDHVEAGPAIGQPRGWEWLARFGTERPAPRVPAGWRTLDAGELRFAVPDDWSVPYDECSPASSNVVEVTFGSADATLTCLPVRPPATSILNVVLDAPGPTTGTPVTVGSLPAVRQPPHCGGCPPVYRFAGGDQVTVTGPDAARV